MDKNINQPPVMPKSKGNLVSQEDYNEWKQYERDLAAYKSAERPAEAPASSGHTATQCRICFELYEKYFGRLPKENDEALDFAHFVSDEIKAEAAKEYLGGLEVADGVNEKLSKELQEAKAKLLKAWQTCTSLHIMLNKCQPYIDDLQTDNIHDPSVGIRRDDDLQALADEMKHFVDVKSIDAYHESMLKELQEARAALEKIKNLSKYKSDHDQILYDFKEINEVANAALSTNLKDR